MIAASPRPSLFAVGGAHVDRRGRMTAEFIPGASIPGTMVEEAGGGTFNAMRNAAQCGVAVSLMSMRGADSAGETVAREIAAYRIADLSAVFLDRATPSYTALVDRHGEVLTGLADMALYEIAFPKQLRRSKVRATIAENDAIFCDANLPAAALDTLTRLAGGKPVFAIAISPAKAVRFAGLLPRLAVLFMNRREAAALARLDMEASPRELVAALRAAGLTGGVITAGSGSVVGFDATGTFSIDPPPLTHVSDATGAGDALAGVTVAALLRGVPLHAALREGVAAARLTIASPKAVASIAAAALSAALALVPEATAVA